MPVIDSIPFSEIPHFSKRDIAYQTSHPQLRDFYKYEVSLSSFKDVIEKRKNFNTNRAILKKVIKSQYEGRTTSDELKESIISEQSI